MLAEKWRGESLDLRTTSLFLQSLPWVLSVFLVSFFLFVVFLFFCLFDLFFSPNKHAVWFSLSHIGQDIRLRFFWGEGSPMEIERSYFLCKSHDVTLHNTIATQEGFAQGFQFAWINAYVLRLGNVLKLPKEFTTHVCQMKRNHPSCIGWDSIPA